MKDFAVKTSETVFPGSEILFENGEIKQEYTLSEVQAIVATQFARANWIAENMTEYNRGISDATLTWIDKSGASVKTHIVVAHRFADSETEPSDLAVFHAVVDIAMAS